MAVVRWRFDDPVTLEAYTFAVNPSEGGSPQYQKNFAYETTAGPDGKVLIFEGRQEPRKLQFSGVLFTEAEYNAFVEWFDKQYQVTVTDDLGREFSIVVESFEPKRERARNYPWKHSYSVNATIVDWA